MPGTKRYQHVIETPEPGEWELSGYEAAVPITEKSNPLTRNLDKADAEKIVQLLGQCDAEIFQEEGQIMPTYQVSFNQLMKGLGQKPLYTYLIAGGDRSVVASRERTEDSALHGIEELKKVAAGKKRVIVIGISVGLSAPFVAGQMDYCMDNTAVFLPVLVGFNPVSMASGSSRMKGGSATKILLETLLLVAHKTVDQGVAVSQRCLLEILRTFERAHQVTYSQNSKIATLMKQVSTSLEKKGRVYLVGWQTLGIIAIMDGVECIHTFGADFQDVRGFLIGDHNDMFNQKAELTNQDDFLTSILPSLMEIDTVVFIFTLDVSSNGEKMREWSSQAFWNTPPIYLSPQAPLKRLFPSVISITWPLLFFDYEGSYIQKFQRELSTKWVLNTVSTGAHVLLGKILQNHMLDLRIANSKLFWRALAMLQVIPTALLSLLLRCSIKEAKARLAAAPSVCEVVRSALSGPGQKRTTRALGDPTAF
ncbi:hypothetical protein A6R68_21430 [Neotoma lepida]|uniref:Glucokinase regulatory protein n=1 Tax=Neotoma lepida TaxID=56216 RepID=A0A1A6HQU7_NEOLE|nr:hypothetical protein A6R68_21430 [Neotoma lepida]